jgi:hypothetical protein
MTEFGSYVSCRLRFREPALKREEPVIDSEAQVFAWIESLGENRINSFSMPLLILINRAF